MRLKKLSEYRRTDLASECRTTERKHDGKSDDKGINFSEYEKSGFNICELDVTTAEAASAIGKKCGKYITVDVGRLWHETDERVAACSELISGIIGSMISELYPERHSLSYLIAGLGNRYITSDAIGHETLREIVVTRHIKNADPKLYSMLGNISVAAIAPGVTGQTGIETLEVIRQTVDTVKPDLLIAIDALAACELSHLATTVQITNAGIAPGSGIGNRRDSIDRESVGCPVIIVGVPTVVESSALVYDALYKAGIEADSLDPKLHEILENGRGFFVTPKESDIVLIELSKLLANAINSALI